MTRGGLAAAVAGAALAAGCAQHVTVRSTTFEPAPTDSMLGRLVSADNGLQVRKWVVGDHPERIAAALARSADGAALPPQQAARLRRDGLRLVRVRSERLDSLLAELGIAPVDLAAWYGQVYAWREVLFRPVADAGAIISAGGRVQRLKAGQLRLVTRSWTVSMEDGPRIYLELLTELRQPDPPSLRRLLGRPGLEGRVFESTAVSLLLEPGYAYVLTGESPRAEWVLEHAEEPEGEQPAEPAASRIVADASPAVGPGATAPDTLGEFLLSTATDPPLRTLVVLVPTIPDRLYAPYHMTRPDAESPEPEGEPLARD